MIIHFCSVFLQEIKWWICPVNQSRSWMVTCCIYDYIYVPALFLLALPFKTEPHWHSWQRPRLIRHTLWIQTLLSTFYSIFLLSFFPPNFCMYLSCFIFLKISWDFPADPVVKTSLSNADSVGSIPGQGDETPHASGSKSQNIKQKQSCNMFNKLFENGPH